MIYSLSGKIIKKTLNAVVVSCGGVGYYVQCPTSVAGALPGVGREATLYTVMSVTENDVSLYGFATEEQQACFEMLTAVSGVGPKVGLAILSVMEPQRVALAISAGDHKAFKAASGVGPKLAQRIVLELKDRVKKMGFTGGTLELTGTDDAGIVSASQNAEQAVQALIVLGYTQSEAAQAVAKKASAVTRPAAKSPPKVAASPRTSGKPPAAEKVLENAAERLATDLRRPGVGRRSRRSAAA